MPLSTDLTRLLGTELPIIEGGMQNVGYADLAAAVSNAGGFGMITALTFADPNALAQEIEKCRALTAKPFGVNISVFPTMRPPDYGAIVDAIADAGLEFVETAGTPEVREVWDLLKARGVGIIHKCTSIRHAMSAQQHGAAAIAIDGFECAGHPGEDDIPGLILIPRAVDQLAVPVIASGGFADGRGLVAALALGACGITMGTRFCATREAAVHPQVKAAYVENSERDTVLLYREFRNTARVGRNKLAETVAETTRRPGAVFADVAALVSGIKGREVLEMGDMEAGIYWAGMSQGLINDIPSCADLLGRIAADAESIIRERLAGTLS
jgi:NAD(P)H-dependent flavin oxidoreductase YrpB (nitropropane dioxygenase family)